jgi:hypothetical protein
MGMSYVGVVVGCDLNQEWLLSWWWENYSKYNSYPVMFADFGMTEEGRKWCLERGGCISAPDLFDKASKERVLPETRDVWEQFYGTWFWKARPIWFKKPYACKNSPFKKSIWVDLDCRIEGNLEPLFKLLESNIDIAMHKRDSIVYNAGVIAYNRESSIISKWVELAEFEMDKFPGDEDALVYAISVERPVLFELPEIYNLHWEKVPCDKNLITHFQGVGKGKLYNEIIHKKKVVPLCQNKD